MTVAERMLSVRIRSRSGRGQSLYISVLVMFASSNGAIRSHNLAWGEKC